MGPVAAQATTTSSPGRMRSDSHWVRYTCLAALCVALFGLIRAGLFRQSGSLGNDLSRLNTSLCIGLLAAAVLCTRCKLISRSLIALAGVLAASEWAARADLFWPELLQQPGGPGHAHFLSGGATAPIALVLLVIGMTRIRLGRVNVAQVAVAFTFVVAAMTAASRGICAVFPGLTSPQYGMTTITAIGVMLLAAALIMRNPHALIARILVGTGPESLTTKLVAPLTALLVVSIAGVAGVFVSSARRSIDDQLVNESRLAMASLRSVITGSPTNADAQRGLEEMLKAGRIGDAVVVDVRTRRIVVASNRVWIGQSFYHLPWEYFASDLSDAIATGKEHIDLNHSNGEQVDITAFITRPTASVAGANSNGMLAMLHLNAHGIRSRAMLQAWQLGSLAIVLFVTAIAVGAHLVRRRLLGPISNISGAIADWSGGNHLSRVAPSADDELGRIGGALNRMLDTVEAQRQQISLLATVSRRTSNAVVILDVDSRIVWANEAFTGMSGYSPDEYVTRRFHDVVFSERTDAFTVNHLDEAIAACEGIRVEALLSGKDEREYWVDLDVQPMRNDAGNVDGFIVVQTDIDARKRTEVELDRVRGHLYTAVETIDASMIMFDKHDQFVMCNSAYREANRVRPGVLVRGTPFAKIAESFYLNHPHLMEGRSIEECAADDLNRFRGGLTSWTIYLGDRYIRLSSCDTPDGGFVCLGTDVTEMQLIQSRLEAAFHAADSANRTKTEFLANMSHEIRSPMSAILGYAEMLGDDEEMWANPNERHRSIEVIRRSGEHLLTIINDILDLSKIEAGKMTIESTPFCPALIVSNVLELYDVTAVARNLELTADYETPIPEEIEGDPVRTQQVVSNLVSNALKFTKKGSVRVAMRLEKPSDGIPMLKIRVRDTGIGMTPEQVSRLFRAFEQADASTTRQYGGSGLGLRISQRLAQLMGGDVAVVSQYGRGSEFTFSLPVPRSQVERLVDPSSLQAGNTAHDHDERALPDLSGVRVLFMDDNPDDRALFTRYLQSAGAQVVVAENGRVGLCALTIDGEPDGELKTPAPFDLILLDVQMPVLDGLEVATRLRRRNCRIPMIAVTADAIAGSAECCSEAGCDDFITKPADRATLLEACVRVIGTATPSHVEMWDADAST